MWFTEVVYCVLATTLALLCYASITILNRRWQLQWASFSTLLSVREHYDTIGFAPTF